MTARLLLLAAALAVAAVRVEAAPPDPKTRSVSGSKQFIVYCPDAALRARITGLVEEWKFDVLQFLGENNDRSKIPIIVTLDKAPRTGAVPMRFGMFGTPDGAKIEINIQLGEDPVPVNLRKQIVRAVLLDYAYRDRPPIHGGERYTEAPWWLVDGAIEIFRRRDLGVDSELFQRLVETNKFPPIEAFLGLRGGDLGATAEAIDSACAMGLVQALLEQPNGRANLASLLRHWPDRSDDPVGALTKDFPALAGDTGALQKWWTLNLARFAAADRYKGFTSAETDKQLTALLPLELTLKDGTKKIFAPGDYAEFLKLPTARAELRAKQKAILALGTQASALFRPVVADYAEIFALLARGKTRHLDARLDEAERFRAMILHRMEDIADYLNWYEATQLGTRTSDFDSYLKAASEFTRQDTRPSDPVAHYLDQLEQEY